MTDKLRAWLKAQHMTQRDLSKRLGVTEDYVYMVTNGGKPITPSFIGRFAQAFGFSVAAELFGEEAQAVPVASLPEVAA